MGIYTYVACRKCKVYRDLDKFYTAFRGEQITDRTSALEFAKEVEKDSFRSGLLVSFIGKHGGHDCVFFDDSNLTSVHDEIFDDKQFKEDKEFWKTD